MHFSPRSIQILAPLPHTRGAGSQEASLPPNKPCLLAFLPLCSPLLVSELVLWSRKYTSDTVWLLKRSHKKPRHLRTDLSVHSVSGCFYSEPSCHAGRSPRHMERPQADTLGNSPRQAPATSEPAWTSSPAEPSNDSCPSLCLTTASYRPQLRTAQLSPVNPQTIKDNKVPVSLRKCPGWTNKN